MKNKIVFLIKNADGDMPAYEAFKAYKHPKFFSANGKLDIKNIPYDIAVVSLKYGIKHVSPIPIGTQDEPMLLYDSVAVGFPGDRLNKVAIGVSRIIKSTIKDSGEALLSLPSRTMTAENDKVRAGMSGGALINNDQVIGINAARAKQTLIFFNEQDQPFSQVQSEVAYTSIAVNKDWLRATIELAKKELMVAKSLAKPKPNAPVADRRSEIKDLSESKGLISGVTKRR